MILETLESGCYGCQNGRAPLMYGDLQANDRVSEFVDCLKCA